MGAASRTQPLESALRRTASPSRRGHVELVGRGAPGAGGGWLPGRAEFRQGSGRRGDAAGPGARGRLTAVTETPRRKGPKARVRGRGGSRGRLSRARSVSSSVLAAASDRGCFVVTSLREGGRSRESWGSGARRQRRPGHVPLPGQ